MKLVKIFYNFDVTLYSNFPNGSSISRISTTTYDNATAYSKSKEDIKDPIYRINSLDAKSLFVYEEGEFKCKFSNSVTAHINIDLDDDLIQYTKISILEVVSNIKEYIINGEKSYRVTVRDILRIEFDGPEELALIWKLSLSNF